MDNAILLFFILFILSEMVHRICNHPMKFSTSSGSIVMALGIFSLGDLQKLPFANPFLTKLFTLEILVIWLYLFRSYVNHYVRGHFAIHLKSIANQFGLGTWVAGCSVLAILFMKELPAWHMIIFLLALISFVIWLIYIRMIGVNLIPILLKKRRANTGIILLSTVSTQSIVILLYSLFLAQIPIFIYQILIILGYLFYIIGVYSIVRHLLSLKFKRLILGWSHTNSIIHGALSISGLASSLTHAISPAMIIYTWVLATGLFVIVEGKSLFKLVLRIKLVGLSKGALVYDVSQWARIFTYGMYYTFTLSVLKQHIFDNFLINGVVQYGQYGVLVILLIELILAVLSIY